MILSYLVMYQSWQEALMADHNKQRCTSLMLRSATVQKDMPMIFQQLITRIFMSVLMTMTMITDITAAWHQDCLWVM